MVIYLIRHGQTTGDVEDRYGGDYDDNLTELGKQQAKDLAEKLAGFGIEVIYCSPKIRAQETAKILHESIPANCISINDFRERNCYGVLSGMTKAEAAEKYPEQVKLLKDQRSTIKGAEDYKSFGNRIKADLGKVCSGQYETVAIVTHGGPIHYIFREILKKSEVTIGDCAYAKLQTGDDGLSRRHHP
jgi:broad specificity phosphatase PhoE